MTRENDRITRENDQLKNKVAELVVSTQSAQLDFAALQQLKIEQSPKGLEDEVVRLRHQLEMASVSAAQHKAELDAERAAQLLTPRGANHENEYYEQYVAECALRQQAE